MAEVGSGVTGYKPGDQVDANLLDHGYGGSAEDAAVPVDAMALKLSQVQAHVTAKELELLSELIEAGTVRPRIDRRYRFADLPAAVAFLEQGQAGSR